MAHYALDLGQVAAQETLHQEPTSWLAQLMAQQALALPTLTNAAGQTPIVTQTLRPIYQCQPQHSLLIHTPRNSCTWMDQMVEPHLPMQPVKDRSCTID